MEATQGLLTNDTSLHTRHNKDDSDNDNVNNEIRLRDAYERPIFQGRQ